MGQSTQCGVPADNLPLSRMLQGKVNRAGFYKIETGRNRKERRKLEKLNRGKAKRFSNLSN